MLANQRKNVMKKEERMNVMYVIQRENAMKKLFFYFLRLRSLIMIAALTWWNNDEPNKRSNKLKAGKKSG